ncbi:Glycosyltransferase involved in cell wall bisynthesis [Idiomarina zobellii]|nr:Glycosyltransferase involved in cell wall bisynthesis [Idiomarina zobellii]
MPSSFGSSNYGGVSVHTLQHAELLSEYGYDVTILAVGSYLGSSFLLNSKIRVVGIPSFSVFGFLRAIYKSISASVLIRDFRIRAIINRFLTRYKLDNLDVSVFDVVHVHSIHNQFHSVTKSAAIRRKILTVHSYDDILRSSGQTRRKYISIHKTGQLWFDCVVHVSETDKNRSDELGLNTPNNRVIHNPVEILTSRRMAKDIDVLFVGSLTERKRPKLVLEALSKIDDKPKCKIVGQGELLGDLKKGYGNRVDFLGAISHEKVLKLMNRSKILCVPSVSESFGLVYVEAALSGAAVIGYENTIKEMSELSGLNCDEQKFFRGFSPNENDPYVLAGILEEVLRNYDSQYLTISTSLINKLKENFSKESYINKIRALYEH